MFFALKGHNINNPGQHPGEKERIPKPSAENAEQSVIYYSDGMAITHTTEIRKGNNLKFIPEFKSGLIKYSMKNYIIHDDWKIIEEGFLQ